ncbi:phenylalanine--tRNA ligase subunit beta [PVC group bacterium (ex Bugula neritina AB1)]|nr:phenylalanine--tRNA ligase subunit beta [PVC group bacterium (ex Bugula neritina AB1)]
MKVSYNWLKDHVDFDLSPQDLGDRLNMVGLVVEELYQEGDDWVYDFENLANRPDWLSVYGIAREISALDNFERPMHELFFQEVSKKTDEAISLNTNVDKNCLRYAVRVIENVQVKASPDWLVDRLKKSGIRSVNNIVDITNYVLLEYGHPLHAFDLDKIKGKTLNIHSAKESSFITLDGLEKKLEDSCLVIADSEKPLAIAGVMGGQNSQVLDNTSHILLESAYFNPSSIRKTARSLGLSTESSYRFERGSDIDMVPIALDRAANLIKNLAGGNILKEIIDHYPKPLEPISISCRVSKINRLLGIQLTAKEMGKYLESLDFEIQKETEETFSVNIPNCRREVYREADIAEEIARVYGYDKIPSQSPKIKLQSTPTEPVEKLKEIITEESLRLGLWEAINYSFIDPEEESKLQNQAISLSLPLSKDQSVLRQTLLPGLLKNFALNWTKRLDLGNFFEIGDVYSLKNEEMFQASKWAALSHKGLRFIKGCVEHLAQKFNITISYTYPKNLSSNKEDTILTLSIFDKPCGYITSISPKKIQQYGIKKCSHSLFFVELDLDCFVEKASLNPKFRPISPFPAINRDLVLKMPEDLPCSEVLDVIYSMNLDTLKKCELFDIYRGKQLGDNKKSLGFALTFQSENRTLTDEEVDKAYQSILHKMELSLKITLRDQ